MRQPPSRGSRLGGGKKTPSQDCCAAGPRRPQRLACNNLSAQARCLLAEFVAVGKQSMPAWGSDSQGQGLKAGLAETAGCIRCACSALLAPSRHFPAFAPVVAAVVCPA